MTKINGLATTWAQNITKEQSLEKGRVLREPVKNVLADFAREGGGVPPLSAKLFWAQWLSVKGERGYPPIPLRKKSAKKTAIFGQKTLILALFDPFF